ncbi:uncharacterized protein LOC134781041 isoform X2 [Penaeus indicus]|uniref:uncharacterized protein LOC134781041 isoform X2 n=1 Tax=Penaeus indicus TaxID=29960 RepID=UPI00300D25D7
MIKTMTGPLRYQFAIITAYHLACVLVLASEVPHDLVRRQADEDASQIVFSNSNPSQNSLNGDPSSDPQKVEIRPSDWRFLELLQVNSSAPQNIIEAENNPDEWHALASTLLHHSFVADQIMQYQLSRLLGDGEAETNSSYVPYYLDQSARLVAGLNDSAPDDLFQSMGMMVVGQPCLTSSNKGHVSALLVALSDVPSPIVQIDQKVTDKDESEDPLNSQKVEVEYLGGVYDNTDELSSLNSSSMSYLMFLLTGRIDKRSISVRVDQDMTVVRNCTDECDITTTEMPTTTPTETSIPSSTPETTTFTLPSTTTTTGPIIVEPIDPIPEEEVDTIVQVIENIDCLDCNETASGYSQSVIIENSYEMDDFEKALSRLQESESGHCVIEAVYSQGVNSTANATWYYMDQRELVWTEVEEEYERDIHIGHGLVVILPLISNNGSVSYVILAKTYVDEPASPIVQIQQAFIDHSGCGCVDENVNEDETNVTHYVSQHFEHRYNYSDLALDLDSMTDYIKMLEAVPPFERQYIDIIAFNEIEGPDCNETTTTMETTSTVETTTPEETTTTVETTTPEETTTVGTTTTVETTTRM